MIVFFDTEVSLSTNTIQDFGALNLDGQRLHTKSITEFCDFIKDAKYLVGHNVFKHDFVYLDKTSAKPIVDGKRKIDTLLLSTLLFPQRPYHALIKDDKIDSNSLNNPLNDALNSQKLFLDEVSQFNQLDKDLQMIFYTLLNAIDEFNGFFKYLNLNYYSSSLGLKIKQYFYGRICQNANINQFISNYPIELAYSLALINTNDVNSILPPWVLINYPNCNYVLRVLREQRCEENCQYCNERLDPHNGLKRYFNYPKFREFDGQPLQEEAVKAALKQESILVVFPTGGGKSLTFQLPALIGRETSRGLTVVISPLQSLMKDQVDNLEDKSITEAVTINGLLDPIQRANAIERVRDGSAGILYIAPESLRSRTIEKLLVERNLIRIVIDEAHCFSTWGHDFRVDYLYIGNFIKKIMELKKLKYPIPISCFTATAKVDVIKDITNYFKEKLDLDMRVFQVGARRHNLEYKVLKVEREEKYPTLRSLIEQENCPTIVYAATRKTVEDIAERLRNDGFNVSYFHGGLENKDKLEQQNLFMSGQRQIMVATNAFGMGVDKQDIKAVIHYEISSSLENYVQEAGRAGRDQNLHAHCYILYNEDDLNNHFSLLNFSKLNHKEIQQIWRSIKELSKNRETFTQSALEIAKTAGWDTDISDLQTRVITAIAALEEAGYIKRGINSPRVFATSLLIKSYMDAEKIIEESKLFEGEELVNAKRIIKKFIGFKWKSKDINDAEARVDYISDQLGIVKEQVVRIIHLFREIGILEDYKDLYTYLKVSTRVSIPLKNLDNYQKLVEFILSKVELESKIVNLKEINEEATNLGINSSIKNLVKSFNYLTIINALITKKENQDNIRVNRTNNVNIDKKVTTNFTLATFVLEELYHRMGEPSEDDKLKLVSFSVIELKNLYLEKNQLLNEEITIDDIEQALLLLEKFGIIHLEGGFMVVYSPLTITRVIRDNKYLYSKTDYGMLEKYYEGKTAQIHIVGEYANKMIDNYQQALTFVDDYFKFEYDDFLAKYFTNEKRSMMKNNMTKKRFDQLFGSLSLEQLAVIKDKDHRLISVAAGPGSGKTKLLVHKLASIIFTEDVRQEQLLMLTFSRAAVVEFKKRLIELIGQAGQYVEIKTFHSYAFDILGRVGNLESTENIIHDATELIKNGEVDPSRATKMIVVIDEAQDMNEQEYGLIQALIEYNENLRLVAVGDDDQNIFEFRGSSSKYFHGLTNEEGGFYELSTNFRSRKNIVDFANIFVEKIEDRLKKIPIRSQKKELGTIRVIKYLNDNFINRIVDELIENIPDGKTCILTRTNEQASIITGLLNRHSINARLIQSNDDFRLINLFEIKRFLQLLSANIIGNYINDEAWLATFTLFKEEFRETKNYSLIETILFNFYETKEKISYISDFMVYLNEINFNDFLGEERLLVSTFHKAKGKEFDNVIILYDNEYKLSNTDLRLLYVGITRAKNNLTIHTNSKYFSRIIVENLRQEIDETMPEKPDLLVYQLSFRDVQLSYSKVVSHAISTLKSGNELEFDQFPILTFKGRKVMKFSTKYVEEYKKIIDLGYRLSKVVVNYLVYWTDRNDFTENLIVLPELYYEVDNTTTVNDNTIVLIDKETND